MSNEEQNDYYVKLGGIEDAYFCSRIDNNGCKDAIDRNIICLEAINNSIKL